MMKIRLVFIPDMEKLIHLFMKSEGQVLLRLPDLSLYDLKQGDEQRKYLEQGVQGRHGAEIHFSDKRDYFNLIHYMIGDAA